MPGTFDWEPNDIDEQEIYRTLVTEMESGAEQRRKKGEPKRRYTMTFNRNRVDADEIYDFYKANEGRYGNFTFVHPITEETMTARFDTDIFSRQNAHALIYTFGISVIEILPTEGGGD